MTSKEDLIAGIDMLVKESRRVAEQLDEAGWAKVQDHDGWKNTEVLAHIAGVSNIVAPFVANALKAEQSADTGTGVNIDQLNAGLVAARKGKSITELVEEIEKGYAGAKEFIRGLSDEDLAQKRTFAGYVEVPISDLMHRIVVLHGLSHIYSVYSAVAFN